MDLNKLTENAQKGIASAQATAAQQGHQAVEVEHLLHSLATQSDGLIPRLIEKLGAQPRRFAERLESEIARLPKVSGPGVSPGSTMITLASNPSSVARPRRPPNSRTITLAWSIFFWPP